MSFSLGRRAGKMTRAASESNRSKLDAEMPLVALQTTPVALLLSLVAGYIDIVGYLSIYQVYTAHMSGNTAAMAKHIYAMEWAGLARHGWPVLAFVAGLIFGSVLFEAQRRKVLHERTLRRLAVSWN